MGNSSRQPTGSVRHLIWITAVTAILSMVLIADSEWQILASAMISGTAAVADRLTRRLGSPAILHVSWSHRLCAAVLISVTTCTILVWRYCSDQPHASFSTVRIWAAVLWVTVLVDELVQWWHDRTRRQPVKRTPAAGPSGS